MIIDLPNNGTIDTNNITDDFEDIVKKSFAGYTEGTRTEYMYQDKLCYIDVLRKRLHGDTGVNELIKSSFEYELDNYGEIKDSSDFYTIEFMEQCFNKGFMPLYVQGIGSTSRADERIMKTILNIIKIVVNYEPPEGE